MKTKGQKINIKKGDKLTIEVNYQFGKKGFEKVIVVATKKVNEIMREALLSNGMTYQYSTK